jgi:hypothetical protein
MYDPLRYTLTVPTLNSATTLKVGQFDFVALMVTLVTAIGLLAVAAVVTNTIMTHVLDLRDYYEWSVTDVTEDLGMVPSPSLTLLTLAPDSHRCPPLFCAC